MAKTIAALNVHVEQGESHDGDELVVRENSVANEFVRFINSPFTVHDLALHHPGHDKFNNNDCNRFRRVLPG